MPVNRNRTKNEHYVPQRYLRYFATDESFYIYDKAKHEIRAGKVDGYASERYFYDVDFKAIHNDLKKQDPNFKLDPEMEKLENDLDPQFIEHWFANNIETLLFDPIDNIISAYTMANPSGIDRTIAFSENDQDRLSLYMALQFMRSKEFRTFIVEIYERLPVLLAKKKAYVDGNETIIDELSDVDRVLIKNKNYEKFIHATFLMNQDYVNDIAMVFRNKIWVVGYNRTEVKLWTSDNPIVRCGLNHELGLNSGGIQIFFPITPELCIILMDPVKYGAAGVFDKHFICMEKDEVIGANNLQIVYSTRFVFNKDNNFNGIEEILKKYPDLSDLKRNRLIME